MTDGSKVRVGFWWVMPENTRISESVAASLIGQTGPVNSQGVHMGEMVVVDAQLPTDGELADKVWLIGEIVGTLPDP